MDQQIEDLFLFPSVICLSKKINLLKRKETVIAQHRITQSKTELNVFTWASGVTHHWGLELWVCAASSGSGAGMELAVSGRGCAGLGSEESGRQHQFLWLLTPSRAHPSVPCSPPTATPTSSWLPPFSSPPPPTCLVPQLRLRPVSPEHVPGIVEEPLAALACQAGLHCPALPLAAWDASGRKE